MLCRSRKEGVAWGWRVCWENVGDGGWCAVGGCAVKRMS